jgi:hypothetical protein
MMPVPLQSTLPTRLTRRLTPALLLAATVLATGCAASRQSSLGTPVTLDTAAEIRDFTPPKPVEAVQATCVVPAGWKAEPLKKSGQHTHQVWLSPSGNTAYGVIHFSLPLPVGADLVLPFYLKAMKKTEGEAILESKKRDPELPGIRFVAEGGRYRTYTNLITDGFEGWAIYAGTLRDQEIQPAELDLATRAREHTRVGLPANSMADAE